MADDRYNRWQALGIAQLTVAIALISGLSVAGLGVCFALLQNKAFKEAQPWKIVFGCSMALLLVTVFLSCGSVVTRLLDFRLTARKVRKDNNPTYDRPLKIFNRDSGAYGHATWRLFWASCITFTLGASLLAASIGATYAIYW